MAVQQLYVEPQLQPALYYRSGSMIQPSYQQQFQWKQYPTQSTYTVQAADRNMPPTIIPDNSAALRIAPHKPYIQTTAKRSKALKIIDSETMKEVDTSTLKKTSPASSARSTPSESKSVDKCVKSKDDEVCCIITR